MERNIDRKMNKYNKAHKRNKVWNRLISCLSILVAFCTIYFLILPAITLDSNDYEGNISPIYTPGINSLETSGKEVITGTIAKYSELQSYVIQYDENNNPISTPQDFIFFAKSGDKYYAFDYNGQPVPVKLYGDLEAGTRITCETDDAASVLWIFSAFFNTGVDINLDISIQSRKNNRYFFQQSSGWYRDDTNMRPGFLETTGRAAPGSNLNTEIAVGLWTWNSFSDERIVQFKNGQFQNTMILNNQNVWNGSVTEIHDNTMLFDDTYALYCVKVDEVINDRENLTAKVITRADTYDLAAQGKKFIMFTRSGDKYYAVNQNGNAEEIRVKGDLEKGAIVYYGGTNSNGVCWDLDRKIDYAATGNIDVAIKNYNTGQYINPRDNGLFSNNTDWRPGLNYINNTASGTTIDKDLASVMWGRR